MNLNLSLVSILVFSFVFCSCNEEDISSKETKINERHQEYMESRKVRSVDLKEMPSFQNKEAEEFYILGNEARNSGDYRKAKEYFLRSYKLDTSHIVNLNNLANTCLYLNEPEEAERYLAKAYFLDTTAGITYANYMNFAISQDLFRPGIDCGLKAWFW